MDNDERVEELIKVMQEYESGIVALTKGMTDLLSRVEKLESEVTALKVRGNLVVTTDYLTRKGS